jgi:hypothetical protein
MAYVWWQDPFRNRHPRIRNETKVILARGGVGTLPEGSVIFPIMEMHLPRGHWAKGAYLEGRSLVADTGLGIAIVTVEDIIW